MNNRSKGFLTAGLAVLVSVLVLFSSGSALNVFAASEDEGDPESAGGRLVLYPEDTEISEEWVSRDPANESQAWTSNDVSGITITRAVSGTGILSFTPPGAGGIIWSDDWSWFWTSDIADLMPGDVIAYPEDEMEGMLVNHIAVVVDVDHEGHKWFRTADGNYTTETGVHVTYRTDFDKRNSHFGYVCVWRHAENGYDIADSAWAFSRNIVWNNDTTIIDEYTRKGMDWCNCYATELLLHAEKTTGFIRVFNSIAMGDEEREFEIELKDRDGNPVNETFDDCKFVDGKFRVSLKRGKNIKISNITSGYTYTVRETSGEISRTISGIIRDAVDAEVNFTYFTDIRTRAVKGYRQIYWAADNEIVKGYGDYTFRPDESCTRANFVTMLYRIADRPDADKEVKFKDVDSSMSYYKAIQWAASAGIIKGFSDGTFRPDEPLTRAQILMMLWRYNEKPDLSDLDDEDLAELTYFSDVRPEKGYYTAILWGTWEELILGFDDGTFRPDDICTRRQVAIILYRADDNGVI